MNECVDVVCNQLYRRESSCSAEACKHTVTTVHSTTSPTAVSTLATVTVTVPADERSYSTLGPVSA